MDEQIKRLQQDLEKSRAQLYMFYELTKAMRTTLRLGEIVYIILTGLTSHSGLTFNRAMLFLVDKSNTKINGFMGLGPMDGSEATNIWTTIKNQRMDLYSLIKAYKYISEHGKPRFMEFIQSLSFDFDKSTGFLYDAMTNNGVLHIDKEQSKRLEKDVLIKKLDLYNFVTYPVWIKNFSRGLIIADNYFTDKPITPSDIELFTMFCEQAHGAIQNCQSFERTLHQSHTDPLTGLWNYGFFQYRLDEEVDNAKLRGTPLSLIMIDLDNFKKYNDTYGHIEGDNALQIIADIFRNTCRKEDVICRYGGEEFAIVLPHQTEQTAFQLAERIRIAVRNCQLNNKDFTVSIGVSFLSNDTADKQKLIKKADDALYRAKNEGKDRVILADQIS
ncbi:MAG: sensor domain-containing diguanylate cyclase [Candidatus Omnitrophica bacterium]|nr:sensor domain-containing diguanylate cyclase [Candidatus Omnitrophota bacterium]MDD5081405.1 sensor domain-containing diguanylate cyclase [Candidatus Omnitrophota bacterium]